LSTDLELVDVHKEVGHVLLNYLYMRDYISVDSTNDDVTEFRRTVLEHLAAEKHQLPGIQQLAMHKVEHFGMNMSICDVVDAIRNDFPELPENKSWLCDYLKRRSKAAFNVDYTIFRNFLLNRISNIGLA
jgi:hypothetical protein